MRHSLCAPPPKKIRLSEPHIVAQRRTQPSGMVHVGGAVLDRHWGRPHVVGLGLGAAVHHALCL